MKIAIKNADGSEFYIKFPNWLILNRLGIGSVARSIARSGKLGISVRSEKYEADDCAEGLENNKRYMKAKVKILKRAMIPALGELRAFLKRNPDFVMVEAVDDEGERVTVTL